MPEITRDNFNENFSKVITDLKSSIFIAVDCEFSGLFYQNQSLFDTPKDRYNKLRDGLKNYSIIQFGLSTFRFDRNSSHFISNSYTFYLLPSLFLDTNIQLTHDLNSVQFLCRYGFDFNKMFHKGLSYLNEKDESKVFKMINEDNIVLERNNSEYVQSMLSKTCEWVASAKEGDQFQLVIDNWQDDYVVYVIHREIRKRFNHIWTEYDTKPRVIIVKKISPTEKNKLSSDIHEETDLKMKMFHSVLGFSKIMKELKSLKKPIVGHNLLIDLIMIYKQFYNTLPKSYEKFKYELNKIFPEVYDTKYCSYRLKSLLSKEKTWNVNSLSELYQFFKQGKGTTMIMYMPIVENLEKEVANGESFHESGFDSYCTGFCFIKMAYMFSIWDSYKNEFVSTVIPLNINWLLDGGISNMRNQINFPRGTIKYVSLDRNDPLKTRPDLLYIEAIDKTPLNGEKVSEEMAKFTSVDLQLVNRYAAIMAVQNQHLIEMILKRFKNHKEFRVCKYNSFKHSSLIKAAMTSGVMTSLLLMFFILGRRHFLLND